MRGSDPAYAEDVKMVTMNWAEVCQAVTRAAMVKVGLETVAGAEDVRVVTMPTDKPRVLDVTGAIVVVFVEGSEPRVDIRMPHREWAHFVNQTMWDDETPLP